MSQKLLTMKNVVSEAKTLNEWEAIEQAERQTTKGKVKYAWLDYVYYPTYRTARRISEIPNSVKDFYWRGKRGYADSDAWRIDHYLASFMPELLRHMTNPAKHGGNTYPGYDDDPNCDTEEHWEKTVEKIAQGFEAVRKQDDIMFLNGEQYRQEWDQLEEVRINGMTLFVKYYNFLWD